MRAFGEAVAFDGEHAVVSMRADATNGTAAGAVYVFERDGAAWRESAKLTASDGADFHFFGTSLDISGSYLIVGAPGHTGGTGDTNRGAAYLFELVGGSWQEAQILTLDTPAAGDEFGNSVAVDGTRALVGARGDDESASGGGVAYLYQREGASWVQTAVITASDALEGDGFGWSVALWGDRAAVGAPARDEDGTSSGAAYVFDRNANDWQQIAKLSASEAAQMDLFGHSVDLNGSYLAVGAPSLDLADVPVAGAAHVYAQVDGEWSEIARLAPDDGSPGERFGYDLSLADGYLAIGTPQSKEQGLTTGAVYSFPR